MSTGCKSSHNGFLDVSRSNGGLRISGLIGQLSCSTLRTAEAKLRYFFYQLRTHPSSYCVLASLLAATEKKPQLVLCLKRFTKLQVLYSGLNVDSTYHKIVDIGPDFGWLCGTVVERRSLTGKLSLSCARAVADG